MWLASEWVSSFCFTSVCVWLQIKFLMPFDWLISFFIICRNLERIRQRQGCVERNIPFVKSIPQLVYSVTEFVIVWLADWIGLVGEKNKSQIDKVNNKKFGEVFLAVIVLNESSIGQWTWLGDQSVCFQGVFIEFCNIITTTYMINGAASEQVLWIQYQTPASRLTSDYRQTWSVSMRRGRRASYQVPCVTQ